MELVKKRVMVTGGSGLIGSAMADRLIAEGARVYAPRSNELNLITDNLVEPMVERGIEMIVHCAAVSQGAKTMKENPRKLITPNIIMNARIMDAALEAGVKDFIYLSSTTVNHPEDYPGIAHFKAFGEDMVNYFTWRCGMNGIIIRPTQVYGINDKFDDRGHVIPMLIERALRRENPFIVWGTGENQRDFIYSDDLASGIITAMHAGNGTYTIGSGKIRTIKEIVRGVLNATDYSGAEVIYDKSKPDAIQKNIPELDIIVNETSLESGLKWTVQNYIRRKMGK